VTLNKAKLIQKRLKESSKSNLNNKGIRKKSVGRESVLKFMELSIKSNNLFPKSFKNPIKRNKQFLSS
jgi:hypothetical protein